MYQAPKKNNGHNAALRNQLLSTDIGNIDVRDEVPINNQQHFDPYPQQQFHPQPQPHNNMNGYPMPQGQGPQRFNGPPQPHTQYNNFQQRPMPPSMPFAPPGQPRSRRSSLQSNHSSFNMSSMNNFFKGSKSKFTGGGDDDDDEDGKDVMIDDTGNTMSFDDLTTIKDRGRYGGQSSFDSTPIIPTLQTSASRSFNSSSVSNVQYRKQMTAFKKQAMVNAGKMNDPRAMSLQTGLAGGNPYLEARDPRAMSLQGNKNPYGPDPRAMSLQGRNPYQEMNNDPRARFMNGQPRPNLTQPRTNSLTNQPYQQRSPRAYSLTTNPYQQVNNPMARTPINNGELQAPNQHFIQSGANNSPKFGSQPSLVPNRNSGSGIPQSLQQKRQVPLQNGFQPPKPQNMANSFGGYNPSTPTIEEAPSLQDTESQYSEPPSATTTVASRKPPPVSGDFSHHYLADNTLNTNDHLDDSGATYSDFSNDKSFIPPNEESTPSPAEHFDNNRKALVNNRLDLTDQDTFDDEGTPSKLPRSKGLPHLSLLKIRDEDSDETIEETPQQPEHIHRTLEPVAESEDPITNRRTSTPPPPPVSFENSRRNSPTKAASPSSFASPGRKYTSPSKNMPPSPLKRTFNSENANTHKRFPMSISSMSEYSTFSGVSDGYENGDLESKKKLYQLAGNSGTANDVFVTASQFSLMDNSNKNDNHHHRNKSSQFSFNNEYPETITENDTGSSYTATPKLDYHDQETPVIEQQKRQSYNPSVSSANETGTLRKSSTTDSASIKSSRSNNGSIKSSFKSPSFLQKWSRKRNEKKKNNSFEPVTKPVEIKTPTERNNHQLPETPVDRELYATNKAPEMSKGLHIMKNEDVDEVEKVQRKDSASYKSQRLSPESHYKKNIYVKSSERGLDESSNIDKDTNATSQPTSSASGTSGSYSTNNTIDTELENDDSESHDYDNTKTRTLVENSNPLQQSFEPELPTSRSPPTIFKKLNLTVEQLGIMEEKSCVVRELEFVSKELGDSIKREIRLEDQLKNKDIISSPNLNYENELRNKILFISELEEKLNEERRKRYIAEEHVLLWENGSEPSALQLSYENEKLQSELMNKDEIINNQASELDSLRLGTPKNEDEVEALTKTNKELETVTIPSLKNEIEVLNNDKKRLSTITEKFKLLKIENAELERKLQDADDMKDLHSKQLEDELVQIKQKYEKRIHKGNGEDTRLTNNTSPVNHRLKKTFLNELGSSNSSFDSLKPQSPINGKRITSFSLINVTSPNDK